MTLLLDVSYFGAGFFVLAAFFAACDRQWRDVWMFVKFTGVWIGVAVILLLLSR